MLKLTDEETENLNRFITNKQTNDKIESALRNSGQRKARAQTASLAIFTKHSENSSHFLTPLSRKGSVKKKNASPLIPRGQCHAWCPYRSARTHSLNENQIRRRGTRVTRHPQVGSAPGMRGGLGNIPKSVAVTRHVTGTKEEAVQSPREMQEACLRGKKNPTPVATKTPSRRGTKGNSLSLTESWHRPHRGRPNAPPPSPRARRCRPLRYLPLGFSWSPSRGRSARRRRERHPAGRGRNKTTSVCRRCGPA